ncbi:TIGR03773 family transporter-associated surface protein [Corynebacterium coyleae]|uniref:TIGR03773 family transporter-associated surface protein n=1 Tax=Corynebacterium coyleae TaxID=53374 RepID=UPI000C78AD3B|nr:TIGR03773 family transporter-associated surface protein [Corynebacterium coyleae]PLA27096.1 cell surface protein [Corynebacterium coyleae]
MLKTVSNSLVVVCLVALLTLLTCGVALADPARFDRGHIDVFNVTADGGSLTLDLQEDVTGSHVRRAPEDVDLVVGEAAYTDETANVSEIGEPGYLLPQTQRADLLWPGWDTQGVREGGFGRVDIEFREVSGPGSVYLFQTGSFGSFQPVLDSDQPQLSSGSRIVQDDPSHVHANWLFTQPGVYTMKVVATADGAESNEAVYTWHVGDASAETGTDRASAETKADTSTGTSHNDANSNAAANSADSVSKSVASKPAAQKSAPAAPAAPAAKPAPATTSAAAKKCTPALRPMIKDDRNVPATWKRPEDLVFGLGNAAEADLPQAVGPVPAGKAWMIGATQQDNVPWLGANTQHESLIEHTTGEVTWEVTNFNGPGPMTVFTQGGLGQVVGEEWFTAENGRGSGSHTIPANSHVHPNWVFGAPGTYKVTIRQTATTKGGEKVSGEATLTFNVGEAGNADSGHFDFGSMFDPEGSCSAGAATAQGSDAARSGDLAETGTTVMTVPFAILGLGVAVFGAAMCTLDTALRRRLIALAGASK